MNSMPSVRRLEEYKPTIRFEGSRLPIKDIGGRNLTWHLQMKMETEW